MAADGGVQRHVFNTPQIDLGVEIRGRLRYLYEVKSSADSHAIYTGTGQLMLHSLEGTDVTKTLVLPKDQLPPGMRNRLAGLGIDVLEYRIKGGRVAFLA